MKGQQATRFQFPSSGGKFSQKFHPSTNGLSSIISTIKMSNSSLKKKERKELKMQTNWKWNPPVLADSQVKLLPRREGVPCFPTLLKTAGSFF